MSFHKNLLKKVTSSPENQTLNANENEKIPNPHDIPFYNWDNVMLFDDIVNEGGTCQVKYAFDLRKNKKIALKFSDPKKKESKQVFMKEHMFFRKTQVSIPITRKQTIYS